MYNLNKYEPEYTVVLEATMPTFSTLEEVGSFIGNDAFQTKIFSLRGIFLFFYSFSLNTMLI